MRRNFKPILEYLSIDMQVEWVGDGLKSNRVHWTCHGITALGTIYSVEKLNKKDVKERFRRTEEGIWAIMVTIQLNEWTLKMMWGGF